MLQTKRLLAFTLSEILITLGVIGLVAALTGAAVKVSDRLKAEQSEKVVQGAIMELNAAMAKWQAAGGNFPIATNKTDTNIAQILKYLDGVPYTGDSEFVVPAYGNVPTFIPEQLGACYVGNSWSAKCIRLKNGAVVLFQNLENTGFYTEGWVYNTSRYGRISIAGLSVDPDINSSPTSTSDLGKPTNLFLTNRGTIACSNSTSPTETWLTSPSYWTGKYCSSTLSDNDFIRRASNPAQIATDFASQGF
ncbi:MAG: type II secretion system protein [Vampirovibrionales bacterium]